jgi:hypothetical protein
MIKTLLFVSLMSVLIVVGYAIWQTKQYPVPAIFPRTIDDVLDTPIPPIQSVDEYCQTHNCKG